MGRAVPSALRRAAAQALAFAALVGGACASDSRTPRAPPPEPAADGNRAVATDEPDPACDLAALLARHPLGDAPFRTDLLAVTETTSFHLVQTRRAIVPHVHRDHRERTAVLAGTGTVVVEGSTYPAVPGALFRIDAGKVHAAYPDEGVVLVALVCYEPPLEDPSTDRVPVTAAPDSTTRAGR